MALAEVRGSARGAQRRLHPDVEIHIREVQFSDGYVPLRSGEIDVLLCSRPVEEPDLTVGPVLVREPHALAVSARHPFARHPFARRACVRLDDLARDTVLRSPRSLPDYWDAHHVPARTPDGRLVERGEDGETVQELIALVGAGRGIYPAPAQWSGSGVGSFLVRRGPGREQEQGVVVRGARFGAVRGEGQPGLAR